MDSKDIGIINSEFVADSIPFVLDIKIYFRFCVITKPLIVSSRLRDRKRKKYIKYLNQSQENDVLELNEKHGIRDVFIAFPKMFPPPFSPSFVRNNFRSLFNKEMHIY